MSKGYLRNVVNEAYLPKKSDTVITLQSGTTVTIAKGHVQGHPNLKQIDDRTVSFTTKGHTMHFNQHSRGSRTVLTFSEPIASIS